MKDFRNEYRQKLRSPEEAVAVVKDGDWIDYTSWKADSFRPGTCQKKRRTS